MANQWYIRLAQPGVTLIFFVIVGSGATAERLLETNVNQSATNPIIVEVTMRQGRVVVPVCINGSDPLSFLLDTGYSMTMLRSDHAAKLALKRIGEVTIAGIAGDTTADVFAGATLSLGAASFTPRRIAALEGRRNRDGILGSDLFKRFVVVIDPKGKTIKLHDPKEFAFPADGEIVPMRFRTTTPIIHATLRVGEAAPIEAEFEVDTGCDGGLCLGSEFVAAHKLVELSGKTESSFRRGVGGAASTQTGQLESLQLGNFVVKKPGANFFAEGSPAGRGLAGHIGMEVLCQFEVTFDYSRNKLLLRKLN